MRQKSFERLMAGITLGVFYSMVWSIVHFGHFTTR